MKRLFVLVCVLVVMICGCSVKIVPAANPEAPKEAPAQSAEKPADDREGTLLSDGDEFLLHDYITYKGATIMYFGSEEHEYTFAVKNSNDYPIYLSCWIVGVKKDGDYEFLGIPAFYGYDEEQYNKDLAENGWAVPQPKDTINAGETLVEYMQIYEFSGEGWPSYDPDKDGYYDLVFCVRQQNEDGTVTISSEDEYSPVYKLKVN